MKNFEVEMDLTVSVKVMVEATSAAKARVIATDAVYNDTSYYLRRYNALVSTEVTDIVQS